MRPTISAMVKNIMKNTNIIKYLAGAFLLIVLLLGSNSFVFAQGTTVTPVSNTGSQTVTPGSSGSFSLQNPLSNKYKTVGGLVGGFMEYFSYLVILFAVLALIYVGLQFVLAQGKPDKMKELKGWLGWIIVGVAIVIGARILVNVVINTLQATGAVNPNVINSANNALKNQ